MFRLTILVLLTSVVMSRSQPAAPGGLSGDVRTGGVRLDWNDSGEAGLAGYNVYRSTSSAGPFIRQNGGINLINTGSLWRFNDRGEDLGTAWRNSDYDDTPWEQGLAGFSDRETHEGTQVNRVRDPVTIYFRQRFVVPDPALFTQLELQVQRDDGIVVYLNGIDIAADNLPAGQVQYDTYADRPIEGEEETVFLTFGLPPDFLVAGTNVLAVEVHQSGPLDNDVRFDLQLTGVSPANIHRLAPTPTSTSTTAKPQSKLWQHAGRWWSVFPDDTGTWLRRLDQTTWTKVLHLWSRTTAKADCLRVGNVTHILLYSGSSSRMASVEYVATSPGRYQLWSERPALSDPDIGSGSETATIDIDSTGRLWLASDTPSAIQVRYSDPPYANWNGPIDLVTGIKSDDIGVVTAMRDNTIAVLWSDQETDRFGFRVHQDGDDPAVWSANEVPASDSALEVGLGMADDHMNVAVASDNTFYAAVKTSYDTNSLPKMALLVRNPNGSWQALHAVDTRGTRPVVMLQESLNRLYYIYTETESQNDIVYRVSPMDTINFGPRINLMDGSFNNVTGTKENLGSELAILVSLGGKVDGVRASLPHGLDPLHSGYLDDRVIPSQTFHYRVTTLTTASESDLSSPVTRTAQSRPPNAMAFALTVDPGQVSGSLQATTSEDGVIQQINESATGSRGRSALVAEYTLQAPQGPGQVTGLSLRFSGSWTANDAAETLLARYWNHRAATWDPITLAIESGAARFQTNMADQALDYVDADGQIRVRFEDSGMFEREKKDSLVVDLIGGLVRRGPRPPTQLVGRPGDHLASLSWEASPDGNVLGYDIWRDNIWIGATDGVTSFVDWGATNGVAHLYRIKSVNTLGLRSLFSDPITVTPAPRPRLFIEPAGPGLTDLIIRWEPDSPGFELQRSDTMPPTWITVPEASNPMTISPDDPSRFYRLIYP